ncbi:MAG: hypothetical protein ACKVU1_18105 [bacterium]
MSPRAAAAIALITAALCATGARPAHAISFFSTDGLGETVSPATARGRALGGVSVPLVDPARVSLENPALLAAIERVSFTAIYVVERREAESDDVTGSFSDGTFPFLYGAVPFKTYAVFGIGLLREQETTANPLTIENVATPAEHSLRFQRGGDIFRIPVSLATRVQPWLAIGASLDAWFGSIEEQRTVDFTSSSFRDTRDRRLDEVDGTGWSVGVLVEPRAGIAIGGRYRSEETLTGTRKLETIDGGSGASEIEHSVPASLSGGALVQVRPRVNLAFEVRRDLWDGAEGDSPVAGGFVDVTRVGGGVEIAASAETDASFVQRRPWRVGFHRADWHFRDRDGDTIPEWVATAGTSFALGGTAGNADLFFEYGRRGALAENGLRESLVRVGFGLSGGEPWKKPTRGRRGSVPATTPTY